MNLLDSLSKLLGRTNPGSADTLAIGEELSGHWHYHLHRPGGSMQALCGARIMRTGISPQAWGVKTHLNERYCVECAALASDELASSVKASS